MLWSRPDVIKAWKGWRQWKARGRDRLKELQNLVTYLIQRRMQRRERGIKVYWGYEPYRLRESYNKIFYFVGQCPNISADNIVSEGTDFWGGMGESILASFKLSLILQGQDFKSESHLCPNPSKLFKKWFPALKRKYIYIYFKNYSKGLNTS